MSKALFFVVAVLAVGLASCALIKETNTYNGMVNVALTGTAFAPVSYTPSGGIHYITNLNDGQYGNSYSWLQGQNSVHGVFAGVKLAGVKTVNGVAFGRDNLGQYSDRSSGTYTVQYTMHPNPETLSLPVTGDAATGWVTIGTVYETDPLRKRYAVTPAVQATGIRIALADIQICIDELEILEAPATQDPAVAAFCDTIAGQCTTMSTECSTLRTLAHSTQAADDCDASAAACLDVEQQCRDQAATCTLV